MNGEIDFPTALRERVAMLEGLEVEALRRTLAATELTDGARTLVRTMRAHGAYAALVSGGFTFFTAAICERCEFDVHHSNELEIEAGRLTGRLVGPVLDRDAKLAYLQRYAAQRQLIPTETAAVGDGANDLAMLQSAGLGVAFRAKPVVTAAARTRIDHGDLTSLLYLQGYRRSEFVP
jgi:phosphoserine phosphatase